MAIDPRIALGVQPAQIQSPLEATANVLQLQAMQQKNALAQRQFEADQARAAQDADRQMRLNAFYEVNQGANMLDPRNTARLMALGGSEDVQKLINAQTARLAGEKQAVELPAAQWKQFRDELAAIDPANQAGYQAWAARVVSAAPWAAQMLPPTIDASSQRRLLMTADSALPKLESVPLGGRTAMIDPYTGEERASFAATPKPAAVQAQAVQEAAAGAARAGPVETAYQTTVAKAAGERDLAAYDAAQRAAGDLERDYAALRLLDEGQPITGYMSDVSLEYNRIISKIGGNKEAARKVQDSELLNALLGQDVFSNIQTLGVGARGLDTPAEREYLREVISGTRPLNEETLREMAKIRANVKEKAVDKFNARVARGELDSFFQASGMTKAPIERPQRPTRAAPKASARSPEQQAALDWANANPNDPRAAEIKRRLGVR